MLKSIKKKYWAKSLVLFCTIIISFVSLAETIDLIYADPIPDKEFKTLVSGKNLPGSTF